MGGNMMGGNMMAGMMGMGMGAGGMMGDRSGKVADWNCSECGNKNFGWRETCNRCKVRALVPGGRGWGLMLRPKRGLTGSRCCARL